MKKRSLLGLIFVWLFCLAQSHAQVYLQGTAGTAANPFVTSPAAGSITSTNAIQTCGPFTGTLANAGDSVTASCPGAASYIIQIVPANGGMTGTISSTDSATGGGRLLFKTGVGQLDTNVISYSGAASATEYRTVGTGYGQKITLTAVASGSSTVTILGSYQTSTVFLNSPIHTADEAAVRAGRAYSVSTSYQTVAAGQNLSLYLSNPSTNNLRLILSNRILSCDSASSLSYYGLGSATLNIPGTSATPANRKTGGVASLTSAAYGVATTRPDTSPTTANPVGGILPALGGEPTLPIRTLEPGSNYSAAWYEEPIN